MRAPRRATKRHLLAIGATAVVLAACGGGSSGDALGPTAQVPGSASESTVGFMSYIRDLVASKGETLEPVDASMATPPKDETGEPLVW